MSALVRSSSSSSAPREKDQRTVQFGEMKCQISNCRLFDPFAVRLMGRGCARTRQPAHMCPWSTVVRRLRYLLLVVVFNLLVPVAIPANATLGPEYGFCRLCLACMQRFGCEDSWKKADAHLDRSTFSSSSPLQIWGRRSQMSFRIPSAAAGLVSRCSSPHRGAPMVLPVYGISESGTTSLSLPRAPGDEDSIAPFLAETGRILKGPAHLSNLSGQSLSPSVTGAPPRWVKAWAIGIQEGWNIPAGWESFDPLKQIPA